MATLIAVALETAEFVTGKDLFLSFLAAYVLVRGFRLIREFF